MYNWAFTVRLKSRITPCWFQIKFFILNVYNLRWSGTDALEEVPQFSFYFYICACLKDNSPNIETEFQFNFENQKKYIAKLTSEAKQNLYLCK